jgi:cytochrome P450
MTTPALSPGQLLDPALHANGTAHEVWRWMRTHAPVHRHEPTDLPAFWSVTRYADIRAVYSDPAVFSSRHGVLLRRSDRGEDPGGGLTLALTDPPRHRHLRSMLADRFSERCARAHGETIRAEVRSVIGKAIDRGECDFAHDVAARLSIYLISRLLGVPEHEYETTLGWTVEAFSRGVSLLSHHRAMRQLVELMRAREDEPADDALSRLLTRDVDGAPLTDTEVLLNCENLVGATENAGLSMAAGMLAFLEHPEQWRRLREAPESMPSAVEEVLRWTSSATHSMRTVLRPAAIGGARLEPHDRVVLWIPSGNRDESVFAEPDRFDITRYPNRHLALGFGEHVCIGGTMARHQMRTLFTELLDMAERVEQTGPVTPVTSFAVNGPAHLPVRIVPR